MVAAYEGLRHYRASPSGAALLRDPPTTGSGSARLGRSFWMIWLGEVSRWRLLESCINRTGVDKGIRVSKITSDEQMWEFG